MSLDETLATEKVAEAIYDACPLVVGQGAWEDATQMARAMFVKMAHAAIVAWEPLAQNVKNERYERESW